MLEQHAASDCRSEKVSPARRSGAGDQTPDPFVTRLRLLTSLSDDEIGAFVSLYGDKRSVRAKVELVAQGSQKRRLYILLEGWACRYRLLPDGQRQITQLLLPGDICNIDVLRMHTSDFAVVTLTPCTVVTPESAALCGLARQHSHIGDALAWFGALENSMLAERNASLGCRSARGHLAHLFCELLVRLTLVGRATANEFSFPVTQEETADVLGLTSVHLNRTLQSLKKAGLIEGHGHNLVVRDWGALRREAGFRPDYLHLEGAHGEGHDFSATFGPPTRRRYQFDPVQPAMVNGVDAL